MLQGWVAFTGKDARSAHQDRNEGAVQKETSEHRELRLRKEYEDALRMHQDKQNEAAREKFEQVADDLRASQLERRKILAEPSRHRVGSKRPRPQPNPLWERKLRFAVHRNLAEVYYESGDFRRACLSYTWALDDDRSDFLVWLRAARAATKCGRLHVARRAFETALMMRPGHFLCQNAYHTVLKAIGDADEDCEGTRYTRPASEPLDEEVVSIVEQCLRFKNDERRSRPEGSKPEVIRLGELSWASLVDALRVCLDNRLTGKPSASNLPVAHPVMFDFAHLQCTSDAATPEHSKGSSDDVIVVEEIPANRRIVEENEDMEVVAVHLVDDAVLDDSSTPRSKRTSEMENSRLAKDSALLEQDKAVIDGVSCQRESASPETGRRVASGEASVQGDAAGSARRTAENRPEVRRSSRQKNQAEASAQESDRRQTRIRTDVRDSIQDDIDTIQAMLKVCSVGCQTFSDRDSHMASDSVKGKTTVLNSQALVKGKGKSSSWAVFVNEVQESEAVVSCIRSFGNENSGPADLLLRVLSSLSAVKAPQYSPTLALLWSTLREKLQLHMPGSALTTTLIVEAMIVSGKKAGKAKARRFLEARRLLSHIRISSSDEKENGFLKVRISWLWSQLHECQAEMQQAFLAAEQTLAIVESLPFEANEVVPDCSGPELSAHSFSELKNILSRRISSLKMAKDLEKAREELSRMGAGDTAAARRTVSILSSSVHDAVHHLGLDAWRGDDLKTEFSNSSELEAWEQRLDTETELEPRLAVFGEACTKSSDLVGELVCFSVRLRMGVHYYAAKLRSEKDGEHAAGGSGSDSSSGRLSDLLVQIRKFAALLKKLSSPGHWGLWNSEVGVSGWSMKEAARISALALVSLTSLTISKIPSLKYASSNTDLSGSQKNVRLGFMRCMLAFARSIFIIQRCIPRTPLRIEVFSAHSYHTDIPETKKMLYVLRLCLKSLVARGCCREEGTSGALIKLYAKFLCMRLQQVTIARQETVSAQQHRRGNTSDQSPKPDIVMKDIVGEETPMSSGSQDESQNSSPDSNSSSNSDIAIGADHPEDDWEDVSFLRDELAQCYQCLYQIPELQSISSTAQASRNKRWLEDGCRVSKHIGLSFTSGDPSAVGTAMDVDVCKNVFLFYRKLIFEGVCRRRRDGGRAKRLREVLYRLAESLPADTPHNIPMVPFSAINKIIGDVVETSADISREAAESVSRLEEEWNRCTSKFCGPESLEETTRRVQLSIVFFEIFALHAMSILSAYEVEYKKHKTAERRKRPREVADRLFQALSECLIALRIRPWSVGAWILLGRINVEIADLALDERELSLSSFGLCRAEDLLTLGDGDTIETQYFGSAEACFGFADSLLRHPWAQRAASERLDSCTAQILGYAYEGNENEPWCGFGDDGDIFGSFGLKNTTTSRPVLIGEDHPAKVDNNKRDVCRLSAVRFGEAAVGALRLQEQRYYHIHWTKSTIGPLFPIHPLNQYSTEILALASFTLKKLREGLGWGGFRRKEWAGYDLSNSNAICEEESGSENEESIPEWREVHAGVERLKWYFSLAEAKLMEKAGEAPDRYLAMFHRAVVENRALRESMKQAVDIEPLYKLHATRMKLLRVTEDDAGAAGVLTLLEKYRFKEGPVCGPVEVEKWCDTNVEDWIAERKNAIAEDILSAMQYCRDPKSGVSYCEYHFKSTYCRALVLSEILKDNSGAMQELNKLFRMDAATKVLDQGRGAAHRGYFYKMWNYRITDTGIEPTLEAERKWVRWRGKMLGLYSHLLQQSGEWRMLAAIISRLKRRTSEDLPVDGAILDDLIRAYALTSRTAILNSIDKGIVTSVSVFESSLFRTWDIYVESLRLAQGVKRVKACLRRGDRNETGAEQLVRSGRPWCLVGIHTALRLEHLRWRSAVGGGAVQREAAHALPVDGGMGEVDAKTKREFAETLQVCAGKWALDEKMMKLLQRRVRELSEASAAEAHEGQVGTAAAAAAAAAMAVGAVGGVAVVDGAGQKSGASG